MAERSTSTALLQLMAITATAMPLALMALMVSLGLIRDIRMPTRRSRVLPMLTMWGYYLGLGLILHFKLPSATLVSNYLLLLSGITAVTTLINFVFKISGHAVSLGSFAGLYAVAGTISGEFRLGVLLATTVLVGGLVSWSRLYLDAHRPEEIYTGWIMGFAFGLFSGWVLFG